MLTKYCIWMGDFSFFRLMFSSKLSDLEVKKLGRKWICWIWWGVLWDYWFLMLIIVSVSKRYELDRENVRFCEEKTERAGLRGGLWERYLKIFTNQCFRNQICSYAFSKNWFIHHTIFSTYSIKRVTAFFQSVNHMKLSPTLSVIQSIVFIHFLLQCRTMNHSKKILSFTILCKTIMKKIN